MKTALINQFERLSPGRRKPCAWLLVRPEAGGWQWRRVPGNQQGSWPPPADTLQAARVALLIPAMHCSHFQVAAPPGLKRHEWPLLLEDQLQQPPEQVQVHCLARSAGHLQLLVVNKAQVQQWLSEAEQLGIAPEYLWAEPQLMPLADAGEVRCWVRDDARYLVRADEQGRQQWLVWPDALGEPPEGWRSDACMHGDWPPQYADLQRLPNLLDVRQVRRARTALFNPVQRRLLAVAAVLGLGWASLSLVQWLGQVPGWKAEVQALTGPVANTRQASRELARLQSEQTDWRVRQEQLVMLEQAIGNWLGSQQGWGVSGSYFDGRTWRLVLSGNATRPAADHWQSLAKAAGATASAEPSENGALLSVRFDLGAQP
ncbi:type II secretion system protein GspL [Pseudomonas sp. LJDD11]|uniref:type II secretion system protein GspL n=1 Tax=Pseudomonas sp. LJDD11 TaxID=2931984 RepID=UPI00211C1A10|nr:type II secretion system protein GspL [Pseudomonas sp. LJDD11]MCQ9425863.1 type II secretion system protein GspL [Pseudomonas sp. LJDD11]